MDSAENIEYKSLKINSGDLDKSLIIEILEYYMIFLACFPILAFRYFIPLTLIPIIRRFVKSIYVFTLLNICILAFTYFIGSFEFSKGFTKIFVYNIVINIVFMIFFAIVIVISYLKRNPNKNKYFEVERFLLLEFLAAVWEIYFIYTKNYEFKEICLISGLFIAFLYSLYIYSLRSYELDNFNKNSEKKGSIKKYKFSIIALLAIIISAIGIASVKVSDFLYPIISKFFIHKDIVVKPVKQIGYTTKPIKMNYLSQLGKPSWISQCIGKIITTLFTILSALVGIILVVLIIKAIYNKLHEKKFWYRKSNIDDDEKSENILSIDEINTNFKDFINKIKNKLTINIKRSNKEKIRRMYHKGVLKQKLKDSKSLSFQTPFEIKEIIKKDSNVNLDEITQIYEKARYGDTECSDEDIKIFKKF